MLEGKKALVTGAAGGNGQEVARLFAAEGAKVAVHARSTERAAETLALIEREGGEALAAPADLMDHDQIQTMCNAAAAELGGLDIVVNNAGVLKRAPINEMTVEDWDWQIGTNLRAAFLVTKYTLPHMTKDSNGKNRRYIYVSSVSGKSATPSESAYNVSKAAVINLGACVASEVGPHDITSNVICPGWFETQMSKDVIAVMAKEENAHFDEYYEQVMRDNMLNTKIQPADIARAALFLAGPDAGKITAQSLNVCAGVSWW
jgi:NAD(P)-dependent dehydrogenase (short-subunit alcohol dehydrogenase family)